jgi:hypothetical protein
MDTLRKSGIQKRPLIAFGGLVIFVIVAILTMEMQDRQESERFKALSPTEHLAIAQLPHHS